MQWLQAMIQALPHWRFKDIERLPMPHVELAAEAANKRRDEDNKIQFFLHDKKWIDPEAKLTPQKVKAIMANMPKGIKKVKKADIKKSDPVA